MKNWANCQLSKLILQSNICTNNLCRESTTIVQDLLPDICSGEMQDTMSGEIKFSR